MRIKKTVVSIPIIRKPTDLNRLNELKKIATPVCQALTRARLGNFGSLGALEYAAEIVKTPIRTYRHDLKTLGGFRIFYSVNDRRYNANALNVLIVSATPNPSIATLMKVKKRLRDQLRSHRAILRSLEINRKYLGNSHDYSVKVCRGVFVESNSILKILKLKKGKALYDSKKPKTKGNHLGIEIECFIPESNIREDLEVALIDAGLANKVELKSDGSIRPYRGHYGLEITILTLESQLESTIDAVTAVLQKFAAKVNKSCGLHVHLDMRNRKAEVCAQRLVNAQGLLFKLVPQSRRKNSYCKRVKKTEVMSSDRYRAVNVRAALQSHGTIEVRLHSGTVDGTKIKSWCQILLGILRRDLVTQPRTVERWCKVLRLNKSLTKYCIERASKFADATQSDESVDPNIQTIECADCSRELNMDDAYPSGMGSVCSTCFHNCEEEDAA